MKSSKSVFAAVAAVFLLSLLLSWLVGKNAEKLGMQHGFAVSDAALPHSGPPVLKIDGKEDPDVYLQSLDIQVEVTGNIASTRYTMVFKNRTNRFLEGELTFPLPDGRTVTHYALDIDGRMREAVPVEKARATQVFEEIQQREVDPGILERVEGNNFRTRIYPFPRNGTRTISIGYEEELTLEKGLQYYRLPMAYPNPLEKFSVKATVWSGNQKPLVPESEDELRFDRADENFVATFARENYQPARALVFALPAPAKIPQVMMQPAQGSFYFLASVTPNLETRKKLWGNELAIIWDVSLSGSQRNLQREMAMLDIIFSEKKNANVHLYFLNNRFEKAGEYKVVNRNWNGLKNVLQTAVYDGGTDFSQINPADITGDEILFFSDGISTLSDANFLKDAGINSSMRPIHSIVSSAKADYSAMRLIAGKTRGKFVNVNALSAERLKSELLNETPQFLGTQHGSAVREVYPGIATPVHGTFSVVGISDRNNAELTLLFGFGDKVEQRVKVQLNAKNAGNSENIYRIWAQKKIAELDLDYESNRGELTELGRQFGIVTRNTSLMVLELISDYVRFGIEPPAGEPELLGQYLHRIKTQRRDTDTERDLIGGAVTAAEEIKYWREHGNERRRKVIRGLSGFGGRFDSGFGGGGGGIDDLLGGLMGGGGLQSGSSAGSAHPAAEQEEEKTSQSTVTVIPIRKDSDYMNKLTGKIADDYQIYLTARNDYSNSPAFYFDMSEWFYKLGDMKTALRVLTSIAELGLEDASLYRLLGYRFKEYGEHALQKFVTQKVIQWRPMDPQSYRDHALALADNGEAQAALDSLYSLLTRPFSESIRRRSQGVEEVVVTEINHLIARHPDLDISKIDERLIVDAPVDVRVVLNWNMNNVDMDLYVRDPNREYCYFGRCQTNIGGYMSPNNTGGYGPEQFMVKNAVRGKYQVYVNYQSARQFAAAGPATVMAEIYTKYADKAEQRTVVTLQMSKAAKTVDDRVLVAEFELGDSYPASNPGAVYDTAAPGTYRRDRFDGFVREPLRMPLATVTVLTGKRSRTSIQRVIMQNMAALRHAYNRRLRDRPNLAGRITIRFAINESGEVISATVTESTIGDAGLDSTVVARLRNLKFERIDKPGDVTEVTTPFTFSQ